LGLVDISEQKKISIIQVAVCIVLFLVSGFVSYRYLISPEIKKLQTARKEYAKEKALLKSMSEEAQRVNALANNAQLLEAELVSLRNRVFNTEAEVLNFIRAIPATAAQTNNVLTSIVPQQTKEVSTTAETPPASNVNAGVQTVAQPAPKALPYGLKPIELTFTGDYNAVIGFLNALKSSGQYLTISSLNMTSSSDKASTINVKVVLNLLKMGITVNTLPIQVAKLNQNQQSAGRQQSTSVTSNLPDVSSVKTLISAQNAIYAQRNAQTTVKVAGAPQQTTIDQVSTPAPTAPPPKVVATATVTQKPVAQKTVTTPAQTTQVAKQPQTTAVAKQTPVGVNTAVSPKVTPAQTTKQMQTEIKPGPKTDTNIVASSPKPTESKTQPITKPASVSLSKQPVAVAKQPTQSYNGSEAKQLKAPTDISQKTTTQTQKATAEITKPSPQKVSPPAQTITPTVSKRQYAVRVGKFSYYENAENLVKTLKSHNYNPWIKTYSYGRKTTYWVYVGTFGTREEAERFAESMQKRLACIEDYVIMGLKNSKDS